MKNVFRMQMWAKELRESIVKAVTYALRSY